MRAPPKLNACNACGSTSLIADVLAVDRGDGNSRRVMTVEKHKNPEALLLKGRQVSSVASIVCKSCGLIHYFATDPDALDV